MATDEDTPAFADRMRQTLNNGCAAVGVALGVRIGLFDVMSQYDEPKSSNEISAAMNCKERYIRELLGLLAMSDVVNLDGATQRYFLPLHRRPFLKGPKAWFMGMLPALTSVYPDVLECLKKDGPGGLSFSKYDTFYEWRALHRDQLHSPQYALDITAADPDLHQKLKAGLKVCEIGCGTGLVIQQLATLFPNSTFIGSDISADSVKIANDTAREKNLSNIGFEVQDIYNMSQDWSEQFDLVYVIDVIHDLPFPERGLKEISKIVRFDGKFLLVEIKAHSNQADNRDHPIIQMLHTASIFHCMPLSMQTEGGVGYGSVMGVERATEMLSNAGFHITTTGFVDREVIFVCSKKHNDFD